MTSATVAAAAAVAASAAVPLSVRAALRAAARVRTASLLEAASGLGSRERRPAGRLPDRAHRVLGRLAVRRASARRTAALPAVLTVLGQQLRAGRSLAQAVGATPAVARGALAGDLAQVVHLATHGAGLLHGLRWWAAHRADEEPTRMVAAALAVACETGGPAARAVDVIAEVVRERQELAGEIVALTAQARASAAVIGLAPVAVAAIAAAADPATAAFMFTTPPGLAMLVGGLLLDAAGVAWMASMLRLDR